MIELLLEPGSSSLDLPIQRDFIIVNTKLGVVNNAWSVHCIDSTLAVKASFNVVLEVSHHLDFVLLFDLVVLRASDKSNDMLLEPNVQID